LVGSWAWPRRRTASRAPPATWSTLCWPRQAFRGRRAKDPAGRNFQVAVFPSRYLGQALAQPGWASRAKPHRTRSLVRAVAHRSAHDLAEPGSLRRRESRRRNQGGHSCLQWDPIAHGVGAPFRRCKALAGRNRVGNCVRDASASRPATKAKDHSVRVRPAAQSALLLELAV